MQTYTYSFLDVQAAIAGPGGSFALGSGQGNAEDGITVAYVEDKNTMVTGADGTPMHSLHGGNAAKITMRFLKTAPVNAQLSAMFNFQKTSASVWGRNTITIRDAARGDTHVATICAFSKNPDINYQKDGGMQEWVFDSGVCLSQLGSGQIAA